MPVVLGAHAHTVDPGVAVQDAELLVGAMVLARFPVLDGGPSGTKLAAARHVLVAGRVVAEALLVDVARRAGTTGLAGAETAVDSGS